MLSGAEENVALRLQCHRRLVLRLLESGQALPRLVVLRRLCGPARGLIGFRLLAVAERDSAAAFAADLFYLCFFGFFGADQGLETAAFLGELLHDRA